MPGHGPSLERLKTGLIADRYTVLERLAVGGMGEVYTAYDHKLDRRVAIKVLLRRHEDLEARLLREAKAMARLSHPNVVSVFDTGSIESLEGRLFLTMEFVQGQTLRAWQKAAKREWPELLRAYLEAGEGLAAAHAAGIVHRDFKPSNVLVSDDGRVKVTDFGIARAVFDDPHDSVASERTRESPVPERGGPRSSDPPSKGSLDTTMTEVGTVIGTPGYMAPEQCRSEKVDERTDQFAFCVSLHEALYGAKPLAGNGDPPRGTHVPNRIRRVLARGLSAAPDDRYPTMHALLDDLKRDPARKRRRVVGIAAAGVAVASLVVWAQHAAGEKRALLCAGSEVEANEVWNRDVQQRVEQGLLATDAPYAADTWQRTRTSIDGYMARWTEMHKQTCEATRIRGFQSEQVMTVRMSCLEQRRADVRALTRILEHADRNVVSKALQASMELTDLSACKDATSLTAIDPEPTDPARSTELHGIREQLAEVRESFHAGQYAVARSTASPLVERARKLDYAPALADVLLLTAEVEAVSGTPREQTLGEAIEAMFAAEKGHADALRARAAIAILRWTTNTGRYAEAARWSRIAEGILRRTGSQGEDMVQWLSASGSLFFEQGQLPEALARYREALDLGRRTAVSPPEIVKVLRSTAATEAKLGHPEEADRIIAESVDLVVRTMGADHPLHVDAIETRGYVKSERGEHRAAIEDFEEAIALGERVAPGTSILPVAYSNACNSFNALEEYANALPYCQKSVDLGLALFGPGGGHLSYAYLNLGVALAYLGHYAEATDLFEKVKATQEKAGARNEGAYMGALSMLGRVQLWAGKPADAIPTLEESIALREAQVSPSSEALLALAEARFDLAKALWAANGRSARVGELVRTAMAEFKSRDEKSDIRDAEQWMAAHPL